MEKLDRNKEHKRLKELASGSTISFEHGFPHPYIRGYKVWGVDFDKGKIYIGSKSHKMDISTLTARELRTINESVYKYVYQFEY